MTIRVHWTDRDGTTRLAGRLDPLDAGYRWRCVAGRVAAHRELPLRGEPVAAVPELVEQLPDPARRNLHHHPAAPAGQRKGTSARGGIDNL